MSEAKPPIKGLKFRIAEIRKAAERAVYVYRGIKKPETMLQFIALDFELTWVIAQMEIKLQEAKEKKPDFDYSEPELKIRILEDYRRMILAVIEENRTLNGLVFKVTKEFHLKNEKIEQLEKENIALKKAIEENTPTIGKRQINYD